MKWSSSIVEGLSIDLALEQCIAEVQTQLGAGPVDLAVIFVSPHYRNSYSEIPKQIMRGLDCKTLLGCSAAGIIGGGREVEHRPAVSLSAARLPGVNLKPFYAGIGELPPLDCSPKAWRDWVGIPSDQLPHFILLGDPFSFDSEGLLLGLDFAFPKSNKVGGLASGALQPGENALFMNEKVFRTGCVGLAMAGDIMLDTIVAQGCRPIGVPLPITQCDQNLLMELDHRKPIDVLNDLMETLEDYDRDLISQSLLLGIVMDPLKEELKQGDFLIRNIRFDSLNGVLGVGAELQVGQRVQFHLRDSLTSKEDLDFMFNRYLMEKHPNDARGSLLFSCLGRGEHLYGVPNHDSDVLLSKIGPIPLGGFFCNGEIGAVGRSTYLHGYTSCFGIFRPAC